MEPEKILDLIQEKIKADNIPVNNIVIIDGDQCVGRMINPTSGALNLYSITKNFIATAAGLAVGEGKLSTGDKILSFFAPDELPDDIAPGWENITLHHLLAQTTGIGEGALFESDRYDSDCDGNWIKRCFRMALPNEPGKSFLYSNSNYFLAGAVVRRAVGEDIDSYLRTRLMRPLDIGVYAFERGETGDVMGATGMFMYTWDMWKLGYVYMSGGLGFKGGRILSEEWVRTALTDQTGGLSNYGYSFWLDGNGVFRCTGANGQLIWVFPDKKFIFAAHGCGEPDYGALLREFYPGLF